MPFEIGAEAEISAFEENAVRNGKSASGRIPHSESWPKPLDESALYGLAGRIVKAIEPHTEADPAALLLQLLTAFGNVVGRSAHWKVEADKHYTNLFTVIVGETAKGRKGTSLGYVNMLFNVVDHDWAGNRIMSGLASGEGLIWQTRDPIQETQLTKERGRVTGSQAVEVDAGVSDKRLLVVEPEFARVLQVCERETNTLSAIIRQAWDTGDLRVLTKKQTARATGAQISIIGHITKNELQRLLSDTAAANGFCNRFLFVCTRRSKLLPEGGDVSGVDWAPILRELDSAVKFSRAADLVTRNDEARELWREVYPHLSEGQPGMFGAVTARSEAQAMRLACIYALLDASVEIRVEHLRAGLEVWRYCEDSARFIFGDAMGDPTADAIIQALRSNPLGMTRTDLRDLFRRHKSTEEIGRALAALAQHGLTRCETDKDTGGRPVERYFCR